MQQKISRRPRPLVQPQSNPLIAHPDERNRVPTKVYGIRFEARRLRVQRKIADRPRPRAQPLSDSLIAYPDKHNRVPTEVHGIRFDAARRRVQRKISLCPRPLVQLWSNPLIAHPDHHNRGLIAVQRTPPIITAGSLQHNAPGFMHSNSECVGKFHAD